MESPCQVPDLRNVNKRHESEWLVGMQGKKMMTQYVRMLIVMGKAQWVSEWQDGMKGEGMESGL